MEKERERERRTNSLRPSFPPPLFFFLRAFAHTSKFCCDRHCRRHCVHRSCAERSFTSPPASLPHLNHASSTEQQRQWWCSSSMAMDDGTNCSSEKRVPKPVRRRREGRGIHRRDMPPSLLLHLILSHLLEAS